MTLDYKKARVREMVANSESLVDTLCECKTLIGCVVNTSASSKKKFISHLVKIDSGEHEFAHWKSGVEKLEKSLEACSEIINLLRSINASLRNKEYAESVTPNFLSRFQEAALDQSWTWNGRDFRPSVMKHIKNMPEVSNDFLSMLGVMNAFPELLTRVINLKSLLYICRAGRNAVIVGANGSGKSSFAQNASAVFGDNIVVIPAQKIFVGQGLSPEFSIVSKTALEELQKNQAKNKLGHHSNDLPNLIRCLMEDYHWLAVDFFEDSKRAKVKRGTPLIESVIKIWEQFVVRRRMKFDPYSISIVPKKGGDRYSFENLSDGEKAIFFYISHILSAKKDAFIIVDEPENHLHASVVSKLWDKLESIRGDCTFIYLTHDLNFASSRGQAEKLWHKSYTPPGAWDVQPIPADEDLPEALVMELLGSGQKILFCEGAESSLDCRLYRILFPNYTIKPVEGHGNVISYTRAFNKLKAQLAQFDNKSIGIIDGDFRSDREKEKLAKNSIFCVEAQEVENVLCDEKLLKAVEEHAYSPRSTAEQAKEALFAKLEKEKEAQALDYVAQSINNRVKSNLIKKPKTIKDLMAQHQASVRQEDEVQKMVNARVAIYEKIIDEKNYGLGVRRYNNKGLMGIVGVKIAGDYKEMVFGHLKSSKGKVLLEYLRKKYYRDVPTD